MTRISKQGRRRMRSPRKSKVFGQKTGSLKQNLALGYKAHENAIASADVYAFIPQIKSVK